MEVGDRVKEINKLTKKVQLLLMWGGWLVAIVTILWNIFGMYYQFKDNLKIIQKSTLRNTIWNETIPMHDRLESCDSYLKLGYNSETKKYCNQLLERGE